MMAAQIARPICVERLDAPIVRGQTFLGGHDGDEQRDERRHDAVVQPAFDVQCAADAHGDGSIGHHRQAQRGIGRRQDRRDQERRGPGHVREHPLREQGPSDHRERQADEQQSFRHRPITFDSAQPHTGGIREQQQRQGQLGDGERGLLVQRDRKDLHARRSQQGTGRHEHHGGGDPPPIELRGDEGIADEYDGQDGEPANVCLLYRCDCCFIQRIANPPQSGGR